MIPALFLLLGAGAAVLMAGPSSAKPKPARGRGSAGPGAAKPGAVHPMKMTGVQQRAGFVPGSSVISTFDLVRMVASLGVAMPTPWYPANTERLDAAVTAFNLGETDELDIRFAACRTIWTAAVVGLNGKDRRHHPPVDLLGHLELAKAGAFWPKNVKVDPDPDKQAEKIVEHWPTMLGPTRFKSQLAVALIADPALSMYPKPRDRSAAMIKLFLRAITIPHCGGSYDGHSLGSILANSANNKHTKHQPCVFRVAQGAKALRKALRDWRDARALGGALTAAMVKAAKPDQIAALGTDADQLALVDQLSAPLNLFLIDKFVVWPGGPAPKPYVDWGWVALILIAGAGLAAATAASGGAASGALAALAAAAAGGVGLAGLAQQASNKASEFREDGQSARGTKVVTIGKEAISAYGKMSI